jgi:NTE family protein
MLKNRLAPDPNSPIGLVLSGGGARGAFQVGVWKVLREDPRGMAAAPDVISGTSAGALNGALIAAGLSPDAILEFWIDLARNPPVFANAAFFSSLRSALFQLVMREPRRRLALRVRGARILAGLARKHRWYRSGGLSALLFEYLLTARFDNVSSVLDDVRTSYLLDTAPMKERLARVLGGNVLRKTRVRLALNTVDVRGGGVLRIVNHPPQKRDGASAAHYRYEPELTVDMILASASIPLLFNPVSVDGQLLWDGGVLVNSPMAPAVALGARRIVPVLVTKSDDRPRDRVETFGEAVERLVETLLENAYNIDRKLLLARNDLAERKAGDEDFSMVQLFRAIRPESSALFNAGSYLYFEPSALMAMYEAGQRAARAWLAEGPAFDGRDIRTSDPETQAVAE